jgi:LemA protein
MIEEVGASLVLTAMAVGVVFFMAVAFIAFLYNSLISRRNRVENAFSSVDVLLKKRYDLIPNLVEAVKGYMTHERSVITTVTELRAKAVSGGMSKDDTIDVNNQITTALRSIMVSVENYPQLKASENFLYLQSSLTEVEEQISAARRAFNASVLSYNNAVDMLPTSILASILGFKNMRYFEAGEQERGKTDVGKALNTP